MKNRMVRTRFIVGRIVVTICILLILFSCSSSSFVKTNELLIADGKIQKAIDNYSNALSQDPDNHELYFYLAKALYITKNLEQSYNEISKAILLEPQLDTYRLLAGKIAYDKTDYFNATNQLINALLLNDTNLEAYYYLALTYQKIGKPDKALLQLETAVGLEPLYFDAQYLLASVKFSSIKNTYNQKTTDKKQSASEVSSTDNTATSSNDVELDLVQATKDLISQFSEVLNSNPSSIKGTVLLSEMYSFIGENRRAQGVLSQWINQYGNTSEEIVLKLANQKYENGRFDEAFSLLGHLQNPGIAAKILALKLKQKTDPKADYEKEVLKLLGANSESSELLLMIARIEFQKGDLLKSEMYLQTCMDKNPEFAGCYYELSSVLAAQRDMFGSQWALKKAVELSPYDKQIRIEYIENLIERGELNSAQTMLNHPSLEDSEPKIAFLKGIIAKSKSDFKKATELFLYSSRYVYEVDVETEFADMEILQGKYEQAERRLNKIESVAPGHIKIALVKATLYDKTGRVEKIPAILIPHLETLRNPGSVHLKLADSYARTGNIKNALSVLNQGIRTWPRHLEMIQAYTFYLGLIKEYRQAIDILNDIQTFPHKYNQLFYHRLRMYYYYSGQMKQFREHRPNNQQFN